MIAPGAIIAVVGLMIVPLPPLLLDLLLPIDIGLAVVLLLTAIYVKAAGRVLGVPVAAPGADAAAAVAERRRHAADPAARIGRRRGGRPRDHVVRPVRGRRQLRRRHRRLPRADRHPVPRHQPRRGPHLRSHGPLHPRRHARPADGDRRRPQRRADRRARREEAARDESGARPTSTARWTARSGSPSATRSPRC